MQKDLSKKFSAILLSLFVVFGLINSLASASAEDGTGDPAQADLQQLSSSIGQLADGPSLDSLALDIKSVDNIAPDKKAGIAVDRPVVANAVYDVPGSIMDYSDSLQADDPDDMWFFSVDTDRSMVLQLLSGNMDYMVQLYIVDWSTGQAYPTSVGTYAQSRIGLKNLPAGDYMFYVASGGTVGDDYALQANVSNPANYATVKYFTDSLDIMMVAYENGDVYSNGAFIYNPNNTSATYANLDWAREFYFSWGSGYNSRTHKIYNPTIKSVSAPYSYSSSYASSDNVLLIYAGTGTGFMYHEAYYQSGPDHVYESSFDDTLGKRTPRNLDEDDLTNWGDHILIYDLNTNKTIDFYSVLNYYYAAGIEPNPVFTKK
ncbi:hypothetical protein [Paenibacillus macerans]|uniref:hypothetical protein n=1 Tax=Paenibacillus macerans TaxID=44252 RepID=UPI003D31519D